MGNGDDNVVAVLVLLSVEKMQQVENKRVKTKWMLEQRTNGRKKHMEFYGKQRKH